MPLLKPAEYQKQIKQELPRVVVLFGEEKYLIDKEANDITDKTLAGALEEFNYNSFSSVKLDWGSFADAVDTLPMMAPKRVVHLQINKDLAKKDSDKLLQICDSCPETTLLVITTGDIDFRKAYFSKLQKNFVSVRFYSPFANEIPKWIFKFCKEEGISIESDAANLMHELIGGSLTDLRSSVQRLALYCGDEQSHVDTEVVKEVLAKTKQDSVFDFANAVASNKRLAALAALKSLQEQGHNEMAAFAVLKKHIQNLYITKEMLEKGEDRFAIAKALGLAPFFAKDFISQSNLWSIPKLVGSLQALSITDKALKSSPLPQSLWLENFVIKVCR